MIERDRLHIAGGGNGAHLDVRLEQPAQGRRGDLCILYLHGFASSQASEKIGFFRRHVLSAGLAFCSFDFQGHGDSGGALKSLTLSRNLEDTGRVHGHLRSRGFRRLILMGSSMGGGTALWYAAYHPDDVVAAIHIAPALQMEKGLLRRVGAEEAKRWQRDGVATLPHELGDFELDWQLIEDLRTYDVSRLAKLYRTPTLIFQGGEDDTVDWRASVELAEQCPFKGLVLHLLMDGDHRLHGRLDHLWAVSEAFLRGQDLV